MQAVGRWSSSVVSDKQPKQGLSQELPLWRERALNSQQRSSHCVPLEQWGGPRGWSGRSRAGAARWVAVGEAQLGSLEGQRSPCLASSEKEWEAFVSF